MRHQVIVVGGGMAGLRAALTASETADTAIVSQVHPIRSHSVSAQGGINAALGNAPEGQDDSWERHARDTVHGSDYLADQDAVEMMAREGTQRIVELEHWGVPFSRTDDGKIAQRPFGGAGFPRTCYASDRTGHAIMHTLYQKAIRRSIKVYPERAVLTLVVEDGKCLGLVALNLATNQLEAFQADSVLLATGGAGRVYSRSTNSLINVGTGMFVAYRAGGALKDMEFVQFHPTTLYGTNILITEGARGEGGYLVNTLGQRFMERYASKAMDLAPRDIVARAVQTEIDQGRGFQGAYVHLDLRHLGALRILERLPGIHEIALSFAGVDSTRQPIPVQPGQHYTMGGIDCNVDSETEVAGLFAAGECACVSVHGANRLGGNSLLETVVFGHRAGARAALHAVQGSGTSVRDRAVDAALEGMRQHLARLEGGSGGQDPACIREELRETMMEKVGILRDETRMAQAVSAVSSLQERYRAVRPIRMGRRYNLDLLHCLELEAMLTLAEVVAKGALQRRESRGSHYRLDYPHRNDSEWLKHTMARWTPNGPGFGFKDVVVTRWTPEARVY